MSTPARTAHRTDPRRGQTAAADELLPLAARRHPLVAEIDRRLRTRCRVAVGAKAVIGVSGGPDSVALLLAASVLRDRSCDGDRPAIVPVAVHVNHHLRAKAADDDEAFVRALCDRLSVPLEVRHVHPADESGSVAAAARTLRYDALVQVAHAVGAECVIVAHHADDQLETMLMALCRGAGPDGLSGMSWRRALTPELALVRPMLRVRKTTCIEFCRAADQTWREDPTNADPNALRGRLRRDVIPVLEELWPDAPSRAAGAGDALDAARLALDELLRREFGDATVLTWDRAALQALPEPVIAAGLRRAAIHAEPSVTDQVTATMLEQVADAVASDDRSPKEFHWPGGMVVRVNSKRVAIEHPQPTA